MRANSLRWVFLLPIRLHKQTGSSCWNRLKGPLKQSESGLELREQHMNMKISVVPSSDGMRFNLSEIYSAPQENQSFQQQISLVGGSHRRWEQIHFCRHFVRIDSSLSSFSGPWLRIPFLILRFWISTLSSLNGVLFVSILLEDNDP